LIPLQFVLSPRHLIECVLDFCLVFVAKESGYVKKLMVDYGSRVKPGQVMAILETPELEAQLRFS